MQESAQTTTHMHTFFLQPKWSLKRQWTAKKATQEPPQMREQTGQAAQTRPQRRCADTAALDAALQLHAA